MLFNICLHTFNDKIEARANLQYVIHAFLGWCHIGCETEVHAFQTIIKLHLNYMYIRVSLDVLWAGIFMYWYHGVLYPVGVYL